MYQLTAADFADTGQWKLILNIGASGLDAFLENTIHPEIPPQTLCSVTWEPDRAKLVKNIEETVYSYPRLLDDFATSIVIFDPHTLFIPTELAEETSGAEEEFYTRIYDAKVSDIMTDSDGDITAAWAPGEGVKSFLMRTFPGSRISCNLMTKVRDLRRKSLGKNLYIFSREGETDFILLDNDRLISASTHPIHAKEDTARLVHDLLAVYQYQPEEVTAHYKS